MSQPDSETLSEFRKSFSYGSRTDLLFKFLGSAAVDDQEAAEFFRGLLERLGDAFDTGDFDQVLEHSVRSQVLGYTPKEGTKAIFQYETSPWAQLSKPLSESRVALISAGGLYVEGSDPMGPDGSTQEEAVSRIQESLRMAPVLSAIALDTPADRIRVRHPGYDIRGAVRDYNVVFPIDRLKELAAEGAIGELSEVNYSFVGASSQKRFLAEGAPGWGEHLKSTGVDAVLLVAA